MGGASRAVGGWAGTHREGDLCVGRQCLLEPGSKLASTGWIAARAGIGGCTGFSDDAAYAAMDFLLAALAEIAGEVFDSVAHQFDLVLDIVFGD